MARHAQCEPECRPEGKSSQIVHHCLVVQRPFDRQQHPPQTPAGGPDHQHRPVSSLHHLLRYPIEQKPQDFPQAGCPQDDQIRPVSSGCLH
ncbi:MAG: hypothetical protein HC875_24815 [Anaerolineales bacterium]|nr:hypothetical protein [Anaerolineales bacterium]